MSNGPDPDLLQAFEQALETLGLLAEAFGVALAKMEHGERLSDEAIADYRAQLANVERDRVRLEELIRGLWSLTERH